MAKTKSLYRCSACAATAPQWAGRCAACGEWNTLEEESTAPVRAGAKTTLAPTTVKPVSLAHASSDISIAFPTNVVEVDRVLGGGLTAGSVTLLGGEPGIGKSTLVLQICAGLAMDGKRCLVITGEESIEQVSRRAQRMGVVHENISLLAQNDVAVIMAVINQERPDLVIIDSVQTMASTELTAAAGTVSQVREAAQAFTSLAKSTGVSMLLIGHVTKEGALAGPRVLEHVVDTVLEFEGDRHHGLRFLRAVKHRFGATDEVGVLAMVGSGLESVPDASGMFLDDRRPGAAGSMVTPILQGRRPLLVEVQALVEKAHENAIQPRRVAQGIDSARMAVLLAVLSKRCRFPMGMADVFVSVVGGVRIDDPGADLGIALAIASSAGEKGLPADLTAIGEVGLGGEIRKVPSMDRRLTEASRMGFAQALVPSGCKTGPKGMKLVPVDDLAEAILILGIQKPPYEKQSSSRNS